MKLSYPANFVFGKEIKLLSTKKGISGLCMTSMPRFICKTGYGRHIEIPDAHFLSFF